MSMFVLRNSKKLKYQIIISYMYKMINIMNHFINFCNNGRLFRCNPNKFNSTIQYVFTDIFITNYDASMCDKLIDMIGYYNIKKCMICSQFVETTCFTICKRCVNKCTGINITLTIKPCAEMIRYIKFYLPGDTLKLCFNYDSIELFNAIFGNMLGNHLDKIEKLMDNHCSGCITYIKLNYDECQILCASNEIIYQNVSYDLYYN